MPSNSHYLFYCTYHIPGACLVCMDLTIPSPLACSGWGLACETTLTVLKAGKPIKIGGVHAYLLQSLLKLLQKSQLYVTEAQQC